MWTIGAGATLERCIVADRVRIPAGASFRTAPSFNEGDALVVSDIANG